MGDREKLIEMLKRAGETLDEKCDFYIDCASCEYFRHDGCQAEFLADHLLANGVTL